MNYSYEVKDLQPSSEYEVSVRGMTVEPGEPAVIKSVKTSLVLPDIGSKFKLVEDYTASTTLQVVIPRADRFLTKNSSYFVVVTSDKEEVKKMEMVDLILKRENVKNDERSWIAAGIIMATVTFTTATSLNMPSIVINISSGVDAIPVQK
ncbi:hypothetical protein L798_05920 [Zootermopsis nevadensis]|uniref:Fibronectin type-III domain-containing protein n=1 Tax=Zootermopsis nevadensis TaxID=136037 RepID=A0A067QHA0_ZOONE|nr:hypothetical protein L798_05920 [Zootermopsis nevadensis]